MKIILTKQEAEQFFYSALCNGMGMMAGYGIQLDYKEKDYRVAKASLKSQMKDGTIEKKDICLEDVWVEILRMGKELKFLNSEDEDRKVVTVNLKDMYKRISKTPIRHLADMVTGDDDAYTADAILQTVFYGEILYS